MSLNRRKALQWITFIAKVGFFFYLSLQTEMTAYSLECPTGPNDLTQNFLQTYRQPFWEDSLFTQCTNLLAVFSETHQEAKILYSFGHVTATCFGLHSRSSEKSNNNNFYNKQPVNVTLQTGQPKMQITKRKHGQKMIVKKIPPHNTPVDQ
jgi:hypothetical protein